MAAEAPPTKSSVGINLKIVSSTFIYLSISSYFLVFQKLCVIVYSVSSFNPDLTSKVKSLNLAFQKISDLNQSNIK